MREEGGGRWRILQERKANEIAKREAELLKQVWEEEGEEGAEEAGEEEGGGRRRRGGRS
jgi:hypothetical protein